MHRTVGGIRGRSGKSEAATLIDWACASWDWLDGWLLLRGQDLQWLVNGEPWTSRLPLSRALSILKAAWVEDLIVDGATRSVPESDFPQPDPGAGRTVAVLVTRQDVRGELQAMVDGQDAAIERVEFTEARADFQEELRAKREAAVAAARAGQS